MCALGLMCKLGNEEWPTQCDNKGVTLKIIKWLSNNCYKKYSLSQVKKLVAMNFLSTMFLIYMQTDKTYNVVVSLIVQIAYLSYVINIV